MSDCLSCLMETFFLGSALATGRTFPTSTSIYTRWPSTSGWATRGYLPIHNPSLTVILIIHNPSACGLSLPLLQAWPKPLTASSPLLRIISLDPSTWRGRHFGPRKGSTSLSSSSFARLLNFPCKAWVLHWGPVLWGCYRRRGLGKMLLSAMANEDELETGTWMPLNSTWVWDLRFSRSGGSAGSLTDPLRSIATAPLTDQSNAWHSMPSRMVGTVGLVHSTGEDEVSLICFVVCNLSHVVESHS